MVTRVTTEEIFLQFALTEVTSALAALDEVDRLSHSKIERLQSVTAYENQCILAAIRSALHFAGSASRIFWPPSKCDRGRILRELVGLDFEHPLKNRKLRDHVEHLDERLDTWTQVSPRPFTAVELTVHELMPVEARDSITRSVMFTYDVGSRCVTILGESFDLSDLRQTLMNVHDRISTAIVTIVQGNEVAEGRANQNQ